MPDSDPGLMTIFGEALEQPDPVARAAYLDHACGDNVALRERVEALLAAHAGAGRFLEPDRTSAHDDPTPTPLDATGTHIPSARRPSEIATGAHLPDGATPSFAGTPTGSRISGLAAGSVIAGRYTLVEVIGEGGMGSVYLASQAEPVKRQVALKLVKTGMDSKAVLARFDAERQALAMMDHPNIARVYDGGTTATGQPFFVMELVQGVPITEYCDRQRLPVDARLQLFVAVCHAVQHAHQKGIIHRDLKPGNVLVTEVDGRPTPKVIDFGVAKATELKLTDLSFADTGAIVGTPAYMSPEQADPSSMDIDTRTDVYALGVILYELLVGSPPLEAKQFRRGAILEMLRMVREVDPPRPSTRLSEANARPNIAANRHVEPAQLKRALRGDLDWIVMKALEKDRTRRYETANGFAADILRHLGFEPVLAAPPSRVYRTRKFVRKNRSVVIAASVVLLVLLGGIAGTTWGLIEAKQQEHEAKRQEQIAQGKEQEAKAEADKAKKARDFLVSIFELSDADGQRGIMTARQILDDAEKRIPHEFADQPELRAEVLAAIETVYAKMTANSPLAMILEVSGTVQLQSTRDVNQRAIPQTLLYIGDRLTLAADARVQLVILSDLHKERLRPGTEATVRRKGCEPADAISERAHDPMMTFVRLPKGTFYMGWDGVNKGVKTEIKEDFEIAMHDVTQGQWQAVMGNNPSYFSLFGGGRNEVKGISEEELKLFPVENVSWDDAQGFIKKLNEKERGRGFLYRLPSETEWEYACRGGSTSEEECSYHFYFAKPTNDLSSDLANFNGNYPFGKTSKGKYLGRPTRVGAYPPNKLGLCDVHANLFQWCQDLSDPNGSYRVLRGGCWSFNGTDCRAAFRVGFAPTGRNFHHGFHLARVPVR